MMFRDLNGSRPHKAVLALLLAGLTCAPGARFPHQSTGPGKSSPPPAPVGAWTLIALPDSQGVVSSYPEILYTQTAWIAANVKKLNIKYVVHEGDITNDSTEDQWSTADHAFRLLDDRVPYALAMGNHDYPGSGNPEHRDTSNFDHYFPRSRLAAQPGFLGSFEESSAANAVYSFTVAGQTWLILTLEFGPRDVVLAWAESVVAAHPAAQVILDTHAYLYDDGTRLDHQGKDQSGNPHNYDQDGQLGGVNDGQEMWDKLIVKYPNIRLVLCGHRHEQARLESQRPGAPPVYQLLADYQNEERGGDGYLRVMTFSADGRLFVRTYSPFLDSYRTEDKDEFILDFPMPPGRFDAGASDGGPSSSDASGEQGSDLGEQSM